MIVQVLFLLIRRNQKKMADENKEVEDPAREKILAKFPTDRLTLVWTLNTKIFDGDQSFILGV